MIEDGNIIVCVDPRKNLKWNKVNSLIPSSYWKETDFVLITHEHDDHADYAVDVAKAFGATVVCHERHASHYERKLTHNRVIGLLPNQDIELNGKLWIEAFETVHGKLHRGIFGREVAIQP